LIPEQFILIKPCEVWMLKQFVITPAAGKRLIAKALVKHPTIVSALKAGTIVIVAGTTNGYVAEEILLTMGVTEGFSRRRFFRGVILPPGQTVTNEGRLPDESQFPGDVVIAQGVWQKGKMLSDVVDDLKEGDVIVKGANALNLKRKQAAVLIGHPKAGTIMVALQAVLGRGVSLIVAVGLEKRVSGELHMLAEKVNRSGVEGYRLFPVPGEAFTELDAVNLLSGAEAELIAAGGVSGAEGSVLIAVSGTEEQEKETEAVLSSVALEPAFTL
jgi:hypothetical protein